MEKPQCNKSYSIVRRTGQQGMRPSVTGQAGVEKCATDCDSLSLSTITSGTITHMKTANNKVNIKPPTRCNNIRIATINVRTLQDDIKLATILKTASDLDLDISTMQEVTRTSLGLLTFDNASLKGWKLV